MLFTRATTLEMEPSPTSKLQDCNLKSSSPVSSSSGRPRGGAGWAAAPGPQITGPHPRCQVCLLPKSRLDPIITPHPTSRRRCLGPPPPRALVRCRCASTTVDGVPVQVTTVPAARHHPGTRTLLVYTRACTTPEPRRPGDC